MLLYVDLDNFKAVNDMRGHQAGDDMLMKIREILQQHTRPTDVIARLGGDEFAVWLNGADLTIAKTRASQFLERIKALAHLSGSPDKTRRHVDWYRRVGTARRSRWSVGARRQRHVSGQTRRQRVVYDCCARCAAGIV